MGGGNAGGAGCPGGGIGCGTGTALRSGAPGRRRGAAEHFLCAVAPGGLPGGRQMFTKRVRARPGAPSGRTSGRRRGAGYAADPSAGLDARRLRTGEPCGAVLISGGGAPGGVTTHSCIETLQVGHRSAGVEGGGPGGEWGESGATGTVAARDSRHLPGSGRRAAVPGFVIRAEGNPAADPGPRRSGRGAPPGANGPRPSQPYARSLAVFMDPGQQDDTGRELLGHDAMTLWEMVRHEARPDRTGIVSMAVLSGLCNAALLRSSTRGRRARGTSR